MTFVDTNVFMYAVGRDHPLVGPAEAIFRNAAETGTPLVTSTEVLQELLHVYVPVGRFEALDAALELARSRMVEIWPVEPEDVELARSLVDRHPGFSARDLLHRASCVRRGVTRIHTFDRGLAAAFE